MSRDYLLYLEDINQALDKIQRYTQGLTQEMLADDELRVDGVVRNFEIIGEAVKNLPTDLRARHPSVPWSQIAGLRDLLIHQYFSVNMTILWDVVEHEVPLLRSAILALLETERNEEAQPQSGDETPR